MKTACLLLLSTLLFTACTPEADFSAQPMHIRLAQRTSAELDSLLPELSLRIDDITGGRTFLTVYYKGETVAAEYISENHAISAPVDGKQLVVQCEELDNQLVGQDFANLELRFEEKRPQQQQTQEQEQEQPSAITDLISTIENSGLKFIRNGVTYTGPEAAEFMQKKWNASGKDIATKEDFIREIATKSSTTGKDYLVVLADGSTMRLADWLRK